MAEEKVISQLKERVAFLEGLVMSLVAKNEPRADSTTTQANVGSANNVEAAPTITEEISEEQVPFLMRLPAELRADILERVLQPVFAADNCGLTPPSILPVTMYASFTRVPAILQVNQTIRLEAMNLHLVLIRTKIARLELDNRRIYDENEAVTKYLEDHRGVYTNHWRGDKDLRALCSKIVDNFKAMANLDASRRALLGDFKPKREIPPRWQMRIL